MAENQGNLTNYQYVRLAQVIACSSMESIALGYLDIEEGKIKNLKAARGDDKEGFVRDLIKDWACRHPSDQVQVTIKANIFMCAMTNCNYKLGLKLRLAVWHS